MRRQFHKTIRALPMLAGVVALAQNPQAPMLGYLAADSPVSVRPIAGAPGAIVLGGPMALPQGVTRVIPVPGQSFSIVELGTESGVMTLSPDSPASVTAIPNSFAHSDRVAFSPSGAVAVLYSASLDQAQVIRGLPSAPQIARTIDMNGNITCLAVSDDGQVVLAGTSDGAAGAIWSFAAGQSPQQLTAAGDPSALRFFPGGRDAVAADRGFHQVLRLPAGSAAITLAGAEQGIQSPSDLEISSDQQTVWVADSGPLSVTRREKQNAGGKLFGIDLSSGAITVVDSPILAGRVTRLAGNSVFLLTSRGGAVAGVWAPSANAAVWRLTGAE